MGRALVACETLLNVCTAERGLGFLHRHPRALDADERLHVRQHLRGLDAPRASGRLPEAVLSERRGFLTGQHVVQSRRRQGRHRTTVSTSSPRHVFMAALCNRGAIIFLPCSFFLSSSSSSSFSSPNLSGRRMDVYHTSKHGVALVRI